MTSKLKYNPLLKLNLQEENEGEEITVDQTLDPDSSNPIANSAVANEFNTIIQRIDNYQDVDVTDIAGFESAVVLGATGSVRIHLRSDITLTSDVSYNLDNVQVYGHDNNINLQNYTFTVQGNTCYFYQVRFNANSNVTANSASNYSNACINLFGTSSSTRFFFEYVIFRNFLCKASDVSTNIFNVKNVSGSYPSLHLYLMFCEVMTNYVNDNINNCTAVIYHSGSLNALTCHNVDFWGNKSEANSCPNWCYAGNNVVGAAKLGWISDGSCIYNQISGALTPNMVNQYNPGMLEFNNFKSTIAGLRTMTETEFNNLQSYEPNILYFITQS